MYFFFFNVFHGFYSFCGFLGLGGAYSFHAFHGFSGCYICSSFYGFYGFHSIYGFCYFAGLTRFLGFYGFSGVYAFYGFHGLYGFYGFHFCVMVCWVSFFLHSCWLFYIASYIQQVPCVCCQTESSTHDVHSTVFWFTKLWSWQFMFPTALRRQIPKSFDAYIIAHGISYTFYLCLFDGPSIWKVDSLMSRVEELSQIEERKRQSYARLTVAGLLK